MKMVIFTALLIVTCIGGLFVTYPFLYFGSQLLLPSIIPWDAKNAYAKCDSAIAGSSAWPYNKVQSCLAMHMCANEAILSGEQYSSLLAQIKKLSSCEAP